IATAKNTPEGIRLIPFIYSADIAYMMEFGDLYARFYYDGAPLKTFFDADIVPVEIVTPYLVADLPAVHYKHVGDVMRLVHGDYPPQKLSRTTTTSFTMEDVVFNKGPFRTRNDIENDDGVTMTYDGAVAIGSSGTMTASSAVFDDPLHIGALFKLTHPRDLVIDEISGTGSQDSTGIEVEGTFTFVTHGTWSGTVQIQRKDGDADYEAFRTYTADDDRNVQFSYVEKDDNIFYRISTDTINGDFAAEITVDDTTNDSIYRVTGVSSSTVAIVEVVSVPPVASPTVTTLRWAEGSWSHYRGFPSSITFFEARCVYLGMNDGLVTIWFSAAGDFENFKEGTDDSDAFSISLSSTNDARWIDGLETLCVGTSGDEWRIMSSKLDSPITPTNFTTKQQTTYGSDTIQPTKVNDVIMYTDMVSRKVREFTFSDSLQKYTSPDLTALAEHITDGGVTSVAYQKNPDPVLWSTRGDGMLLSQTYEREQNVVAWSKHPMGWTTVDSSDVDWDTSVIVPMYPVLRELTDAEIPAKPATPTVADGITTIANASELDSKINANKSGSFILTADINLSGVSWTPITDFEGTLDGDGHTISNLSISTGLREQGLFGTVIGAVKIKDLTLNSFTIAQTGYGNYRGALVGYAEDLDDAIFLNIKVINSSIDGYNYTGGMFGLIETVSDSARCQIFQCSVSNTDVEGSRYIGGLIGSTYIGGDTDDASEMVDCYSVNGTVTTSYKSVGGFVGYLDGYDNGTTDADVSKWMIVHSCYSTNDIVSTSDLEIAGGFAGEVYIKRIVNCYSTGSLTAGSDLDIVGGFIGLCSGYFRFTNCYATGDITGVDDAYWVAGFCAKFDSTGQALRCYATGDINITGTNITALLVGGFSGFIGNDDNGMDAWVKRCWSESDINFETGPVSLSAVGCFTGAMTGYSTLVENCYAWGSITKSSGNWPTTAGTTSDGVGGFIGTINGAGDTGFGEDMTIENCYCAQTNIKHGSGLENQVPNIVGDSGGFGGKDHHADANTLTTTECFFDKETCGFDTDATTALASTTSVMQTESTFDNAGWDMDTIWVMDPQVTNYIQMDAEGEVSSVAVIPGMPDVKEDEVWCAVLRNVGGTSYRFVERMWPRAFPTQSDCRFVDCGVFYDGEPATVI
ncbi:MAG: hypothetical protein DRJ03_27775, partial [Chloroflexi bacterium]